MAAKVSMGANQSVIKLEKQRDRPDKAWFTSGDTGNNVIIG